MGMQGEDVLFMETSIKRHRQRHAVIDVIPMDKEVAADAPIYFQKVSKQAYISLVSFLFSRVTCDFTRP